MLGEFNKILFNSTISNGYLLCAFIDNKGLKYVEDLVKWLAKVTLIVEKEEGNIRIDFCKHI